ncbi:gastrula zinc finger protein XlCGF8.2DB-like [Pimephales promelas]|nr:gastrula zinc finger protein XlCGF8.2DB-like [Pimephales promelas]
MVKDLALAVFERDTLATHGLSGKAGNANNPDSKLTLNQQESEDMKIEETFKVKQEDTEEKTDLRVLKEESEVLNEMEKNQSGFTQTVNERDRQSACNYLRLSLES